MRRSPPLSKGDPSTPTPPRTSSASPSPPAALLLAEGVGAAGRVFERWRAPGRGAAVSLMMPSGSGAMPNEMSATYGTFRVTGVAPGRFIVSTRKQPYATAREELQLADR